MRIEMNSEECCGETGSLSTSIDDASMQRFSAARQSE